MDVLCIHCSSPHSAELRSTWAASSQCPYFRSKPWMWSQTPGTKSEGAALMYWLETLIYNNNNNMYPHSSQKKCLLLSLMLLFMLKIHYQTLCWRIWVINILIMPLAVMKCVLIHCFTLVIGASPVMPNQKFRIYICTPCCRYI